MRRGLLSLLLLTITLLALAAPAGALQIGLADQQAIVFKQPLFRKLHTRIARMVVPWNVAVLDQPQTQATDDWIRAAVAAHIQPHIAFNGASLDRHGMTVAPTVARFQRAFEAFRQRWPQVHVFTPWNEVNRADQPTLRHPALAAGYYRAMRYSCPKCTVLGADLLDVPSLAKWLPRYRRALHGAPRIWGLHNYGDANRNRPLAQSWTLRLTKIVRGQIWITEGGGIVGMRDRRTHHTTWPYSPKRAAKSLAHLFALIRAPAVRRRYTRAYIYNLFGTWTKGRKRTTWDTGLLTPGGKPRPAYAVLLGQTRHH